MQIHVAAGAHVLDPNQFRDMIEMIECVLDVGSSPFTNMRTPAIRITPPVATSS